MKRVFLSLIILASVTFGTFASPHKGYGRKGDNTKVMKELNLTEDQQAKIKSLNEDFRIKFNAVRDDSSLTKDSKRAKMKELSETKKNQFQAVLTPEQQAKMKELRGKRSDNYKKGRKDMAKRGHNRMDLNLTEDQKSKMQDLRKDYRDKMQALKDDTSLSKEMRSEKRKELANTHKSEIRSLLTPEQQAKIKDVKEKGRKDFKYKGKYAGKKGDRRGHMKLDEATVAKLDALKEDYKKQKQAVELSRIAPDAQKERIQNLKEKYRTDRKNILREARQSREGNKPS